MKPRLIIIDNYDSFTYNLVRLVTDYCGVKPGIVKAGLVDIAKLKRYDKILFSPGAEIPARYPAMREILTEYYKTKSILGICLGHQAIAEYFGGKLINLAEVYHGIKIQVQVIDKTDRLFNGVPEYFEAGLYHSWAVESGTLPADIKVTAASADEIIMAVAHNSYDIKGLQFHPESFMTNCGMKILQNWLTG